MDAPVSSMNNNLSGARSGCALNHARRRANTSGRSYSLAYAVFYGHGLAVEKAREYDSMLQSQHLGQFNQRDVHFLDRTENDIAMAFNPVGPHVAASGLARVELVTRHLRIHRIALAAATPKRSAAARCERPPSTAAITRVRRSSGMDFVMPAVQKRSRLASPSLSRERKPFGLGAGIV